MGRDNLDYIRRINPGQAFDTIAPHILDQIRSSNASELMYKRVGEATYEAFEYNCGADSRPLTNMIAIDASAKDRLPEILAANLTSKEKLPEQIRVLKPNVHRDIWVVFFSTKDSLKDLGRIMRPGCWAR